MATQNPTPNLSDLSTVSLEAALAVKLRQDVADALHNARPGFLTSSAVLTEAIADIQYDLTVSGASFLVVTVIDPNWQLLQERGKDLVAFIDVDTDGFLLPVTMEFPAGSDSWWNLVAANPTSDLSTGNIKLTFEDDTVQTLRDYDGSDGNRVSAPNQTRLEYILQILKTANVYAKQIFSSATINFEKSPPSLTPQQVLAWDKKWTSDQKKKQQQATQTAAAAKAYEQLSAAKIHNLLTPKDPTSPSKPQQPWWATHGTTGSRGGVLARF